MEFQAPVLRRLGEPQVMEDVVLDSPRVGEVRVRMAAAGICHSCVSAADGSHPETPLPIILGDEGAGVVDAVGPGATTLQPGDHVILSWAPSCGRCAFCARGRPGLCQRAAPFGYMRDGSTRFHDAQDKEILHFGPATYSPYVVVDENAAVAVTRRLPLDKAALIGCAVTTGVGAVLNTADVRPGESVAVFGCGGIGLNAVQGAFLAGAEPIVAVDIVSAKLEAAGRLGATHQIDGGQSDPADRIRAMTNGGVDHAIVAVGSARVMMQAVESLGPAGTCVLVGAPPAGSLVNLDAMHLVGGERRVLGSRYGSANPHAMFPQLAALYLAGRLKLDELISRRYRPDEVDKASQALLDGSDLRGLLVFDEN